MSVKLLFAVSILFGLIGYPMATTSAQPLKSVTTEIVSSRDQAEPCFSIHDLDVAFRTDSQTDLWKLKIHMFDQQTVEKAKVQHAVTQIVLETTLTFSKTIPQDGDDEELTI